MSRKVKAIVKMEVMADQASPRPPVGPALGGYDVNIFQFCREFNQQTQNSPGKRVPVIVTIYEDKSFSFVVKQPTAAFLLKEVAHAFRGSGEPNKKTVGTITLGQLIEIAKTKMPDLNARTLEAATSMIRGTAKSMGIEIIDAAALSEIFHQ